MRPLVSVITPLYNYAEHIPHTIASVLQQTLTSFEHIIVDDGSTDGSADVVRACLGDPRTRLIELGANHGFSFAKNRGLEASCGEFITTLDADDMFTPDSLALRVSHLERQLSPAVHGRVVICRGTGDFTGVVETLDEEPWYRDRIAEHLRSGAPASAWWDAIHPQGVLCRRCVYEQVGLYDEEMRWKADREMWYRMLHHGLAIDFLDAVVAIYRYHGRNMSLSPERRMSDIEHVFARKCRERDAAHGLDGVTRLRPLVAAASAPPRHDAGHGERRP